MYRRADKKILALYIMWYNMHPTPIVQVKDLLSTPVSINGPAVCLYGTLPTCCPTEWVHHSHVIEKMMYTPLVLYIYAVTVVLVLVHPAVDITRWPMIRMSLLWHAVSRNWLAIFISKLRMTLVIKVRCSWAANISTVFPIFISYPSAN